MTTLALPERWTFAGVDLSSYATITLSPTGADELPPIRGDDYLAAGIPGRRYAGKLHDYRRVGLAVFVSSLSAAGVSGGSTQTRTNLDALLAVLGPRAQGLLTRLMPDGTTRQAMAECVAVNSVQDMVNHEAVTLVAQFQLADPAWYANAATSVVQAISASPTDFNFTNAGNWKNSRKLTIDFTGPITNPRLTNNATGAYVDVQQVVASTKHLIIDPIAYTVLNDGVDATANMTHGATVALFDLAPGVNALRVTATSPGGSVTVAGFPAWY